MRLSRFFGRRDYGWVRPEPPREVTLRAVAFVRSPVAKPRPHGWATVESSIVFEPEHAARLEGIERFGHVIVVFYLDVAEGAPEKPEQLELAGGRMAGIFATRSQLRPNHLGVSVAELLGREGLELRVRGLDAIDRTPVLDVKPYLAEYDRR
ncbi:TrmO family methyltransferase domain-containing protein [Tepidiforma bonchosmolovskayae]|uniref:SAM-dependent methyltransferase n=1 Tax=Tepidiforma bonchosmolovskayae TaxID=2601677 RepID=A0ABX6C0H6_9CHLR|nr:TrmO family methyltransferase [Tepidiforma bonchosmolovskayae]QFG02606.1 SAM-dependent methyltransferase [Tepidiforma bonchosmolovskayae]